MSVEKKLLAYHLGRLADKNPEIRLQSIRELADLGDVEAMSVLENVFKEDPDPAVRKAAQLAGREIFVKNQPKHK
ncbi:MAG: HEAT repeat domain-containing protein [Anaerolineae bacterium]|nr:HEAT repeat domain-containing protein [Anaerolineae bacterium]NUQ02756.1 HEAT repeat domain-containing protein [Anaerolineae bacterium]